jgi:hypothetical protein
MTFPPVIPHCAGSIGPGWLTEHETVRMNLITIVDASIVQENIDWGMLANDIGEAIEKTSVEQHGLTFEDRAIVRVLPQFIAAVTAAQKELIESGE